MTVLEQKNWSSSEFGPIDSFHGDKGNIYRMLKPQEAAFLLSLKPLAVMVAVVVIHHGMMKIAASIWFGLSSGKRLKVLHMGWDRNLGLTFTVCLEFPLTWNIWVQQQIDH